MENLGVKLEAWALPSGYESALENLIAQNNLVPMSSLGATRLESRLGIAGDWVAYPSRNSSSNALNFEQSTSAIATYTPAQPKRTIFVSSDFRAFFASSQRPEVRFSANFMAWEFSSEAEAIWVWVYLNSRIDSAVVESIRQLSQQANHSTVGNTKSTLYIRTMPGMWSEKIPAAIRVIAEAEEAFSESTSVSATRSVRLSAEENWSLRPKTTLMSFGATEKRLDSYLESVFIGKNLGQMQYGNDTPIFDGPWIAKGLVSRYGNGEFPGATYAEVGDILTPKIGEVSRARVAHERGLVVGNFYVLRPLDKNLSAQISTFLNSEEATLQRSELCDEGTTFKTISKVNILRFVPKLEMTSIQMKCAELVTS